MTDQELHALLSQKDIATSLAEDLLKHFGSEDLDVKEEPPSNIMNNNGALSSGLLIIMILEIRNKLLQYTMKRICFHSPKIVG